MSDANAAFLQGRLTRAPELRKTPTGVVVCDLSVASNRHVRKPDGEGYNQYPLYMKVTLWNEAAEKFGNPKSKSYLKTGDEIFVKGELWADNFKRDNGEMTSGRVKIDAAHIQVLRRAPEKTDKVSTETTSPATESDAVV